MLGSLSSLLGKNIKLEREEGNIMALGNNIMWKKGNREAILPYIMYSVGKNIKWGKGERDGNFGEESQDLKKKKKGLGRNS